MRGLPGDLATRWSRERAAHSRCRGPIGAKTDGRVKIIKLLLSGFDTLDWTPPLLWLWDALADGIAAVPGRSRVDRRAAAAGVLCNMRRHVHRAQLVDEVFCIVGFVGAKCDRCRSVGTRLNHVQRGHPFGMSVSQRQAGIDQQAVA